MSRALGPLSRDVAAAIRDLPAVQTAANLLALTTDTAMPADLPPDQEVRGERTTQSARS